MAEEDRKELEPGEHFRRAKRTVLSFATIGLLIVCARTEALLPISVLGEKVTLSKVVLESMLLVYCVYLLVGFWQEYERQYVVHSKELYSKSFSRLVDQVDALREKVTDYRRIFTELNAAAEEAIPKFEKLRDWRPEISFEMLNTQAELNGFSRAMGMQEISISEEMMGKAIRIDQARIENDFQNEFRRATEGFPNYKFQFGNISDVSTASEALVSISNGLNRLSGSLPKRERLMFRIYDGWMTFLYSGGVIAALAYDIVQKVRV